MAKMQFTRTLAHGVVGMTRVTITQNGDGDLQGDTIFNKSFRSNAKVTLSETGRAITLFHGAAGLRQLSDLYAKAADVMEGKREPGAH